MRSLVRVFSLLLVCQIAGCSGKDAEPGKVTVTSTTKVTNKNIVSTPRPKK